MPCTQIGVVVTQDMYKDQNSSNYTPKKKKRVLNCVSITPMKSIKQKEMYFLK